MYLGFTHGQVDSTIPATGRSLLRVNVSSSSSGQRLCSLAGLRVEGRLSIIHGIEQAPLFPPVDAAVAIVSGAPTPGAAIGVIAATLRKISPMPELYPFAARDAHMRTYSDASW